MKKYEIYIGFPDTKTFVINASNPDRAASKFASKNLLKVGTNFVLGSEYAPPFFKYTVTDKGVKRIEKINWDITRAWFK